MEREISNDSWLLFNVESQVWWKPLRCGYTGDIALAGRYMLREAISYSTMRRQDDGRVADLMVPSPEMLHALVAEKEAGR